MCFSSFLTSQVPAFVNQPPLCNIPKIPTQGLKP
jgi:hypothetical protein